MADRGTMRFKKTSESGHAIMELAIMAPVLLLMLFGTADFARIFYAAIEVTNAAYAGAQYGAQTVGTASKSSAMVAAAKNDASDLNSTSLSVTATQFCECPDASPIACTGTCAGSGKLRLYVRVTATYPFKTVVKYPGINTVTYTGYPSQTSISKTVVMRVQ